MVDGLYRLELTRNPDRESRKSVQDQVTLWTWGVIAASLRGVLKYANGYGNVRTVNSRSGEGTTQPCSSGQPGSVVEFLHSER